MPTPLTFAARTLGAPLAAALALAGVSTAGDAIWAAWIPVHRPLYGLAHGTLLCLCLGLALAVAGRRVRWETGVIGGAVIGLAAAGGYYLLAPYVGVAAMFLLWTVLWILMASLPQTPGAVAPASVGERLARGTAAAVASGFAFYLISGIWLRPRPDGADYLVNFVSWTAAFLPGFLALLVPGPASAGFASRGSPGA